MKVRGIDPGEHVGWCDIEADYGAPTTYIASGECTPAEATKLIEPGYVYAIERAYGLRMGPRPKINELKATVARLLDTNWLACQLVEKCKRFGIRVFEIDQHKARVDVGVQFDKAGDKPGDMSVDQQIAVCVKELIAGWPTGARSTNKHKRDAGVYAYEGVHLLNDERRRDSELPRFEVPPPGTFGPGDYGPDSFGGSDC